LNRPTKFAKKNKHKNYYRNYIYCGGFFLKKNWNLDFIKMNILANYLFSSTGSDHLETEHLVGFELVEHIDYSKTLLINTMPNDLQGCLIGGTLTAEQEEQAINDALTKYNPAAPPFRCILYGKNCCDKSPDKKRKQLLELGFGLKEIQIYRGGMFEWLLLQDIYGDTKFVTTKKELNILKYRATN